MTTDPSQPFIPELHDAGKLINHDLKIVQIMKDDQITPATGGHTFENIAWDFHNLNEPNTETWLGIRDHHHQALNWGNRSWNFSQVRAALASEDAEKGMLPPKDNEAIRFKRRILLSLADKVASSQSRVVPVNVKGLPTLVESPLRYRLWSPQSNTQHDGHWSPILDEDTWQNYMKFVISPGTTADSYFKKYKQNLLLRAEDQGTPRNLTSLYTHIRLVGQIYRILDRSSYLNEQTYCLHFGEEIASSQREALENWQFQIVRADVQILQSPVRAKDLHIFSLLTNSLSSLRSDPSLADYLLFGTDQTLWILLPTSDIDNTPSLEDVLQYHLQHFAVLTYAYDLPLGELTSDLARWQHQLNSAWLEARNELNDSQGEEKAYWSALISSINNTRQRINRLKPTYASYYPEPIGGNGGAALAPPLCEICQLRTAIHQQDKGTGVEYLCSDCHQIRESETGWRLQTIFQWEEYGAAGRLAWVRLSLDPDELMLAIQEAFNQYINRLSANTPKSRRALEVAKANFRPTAVVADFIDDYVTFLAELQTWVQRNFQGNMQGMDDWQLVSQEVSSLGTKGANFFVLRITSGQRLFDFLKHYNHLIQKHFPNMLNPCPIRLGINIAPSKYPFYEHYRELNRVDREIWLHQPGSFLNAFSVQHLAHFLKLEKNTMKGRSRYLHNLATMEKRAGGSSILAEVTFQDDVRTDLRKKDKKWRRLSPQLHDYAQLMRQDSQLTIGNLLSWYKMITWGR